jgi:hypothetical protein
LVGAGVLVAALLDGVAPNVGFAPPVLPKSEPVAAPEDEGVPVFKLEKRPPVEGAELVAGLVNIEEVFPALDGANDGNAVPAPELVVCPPNMLVPPKFGGFEAAVEPNIPGPEVLGVEVVPNSPVDVGAEVVCPAPNNGAEVVLAPKGLLGAVPPLLEVGLKLNDMSSASCRDGLGIEDSF